MNRTTRFLILVPIVLSLAGCAAHLPLEKVYGTYKASYPFGTETITLNEDGSFVQVIMLRGESPVTFRGKWDFDAKDSRVNFDKLILVTDGFGHFKSDWRNATPGLVSLDVEMHWFRIVMKTAAADPYAKQ